MFLCKWIFTCYRKHTVDFAEKEKNPPASQGHQFISPDSSCVGAQDSAKTTLQAALEVVLRQEAQHTMAKLVN